MSSSSTTLRSATTLALSAIAAVTCGCQTSDAEHRSTAAVVQPLGISGGNIPLPVAPCDADLPNPDPDAPACDPTSRTDDWDAPYPELLAADALAECALLQRVGTNGIGFERPFFDRLHFLMGQVSCDVTTVTPTAGTGEPAYSADESLYFEWLQHRQNPACNAHPVTRNKMGLSVDESGRRAGNASPYYIPSDSLDPPSASPTIMRAQVRQAHLELCMAKKLQEHLDSAQVVFASTDTLEQLHRFVRDRALAAVHQYSILTQAFSIPSYSTGANDLKHLIRWRQWAFGPAPADPASEQAKFETIGEDFKFAIAALIDATAESTELTLRRSDAQAGFGRYLTSGTDEVANRLRGSRVDVLELTYGAISDDVDPSREHQTESVTIPAIAFIPALPISADIVARAPVTDMSAPEIGVLVGLARAADAFELHAANHRFDVAANAASLLRAVEQHLRNREPECLEVMPPPFCTVGPNEDQTEFLVRKRLNVHSEHARVLVRALIEHIFGLPARGEVTQNVLDYSPTATGDSRGLFLPHDLPELVRGEHSYTGGFGTTLGGTLQLDRHFTLALPSAATRNRAWAYLPPAQLNLTIMNAWYQGFGLSFTDEGGQLGTVPTLVLARHALLRSSEQVGPLFERAKIALPLLDAAIGPRSVLIRPAVSVTMDTNRPTPFAELVPYRTDGLGGLRYAEGGGCSTCSIRWRGATRYDIEIYRKDGDGFAVDRAASLSTPLDDSSGFTQTCGAESVNCLLGMTAPTTIAVEESELWTSQLDVTVEHQLVELTWVQIPLLRAGEAQAASRSC